MTKKSSNQNVFIGRNTKIKNIRAKVTQVVQKQGFELLDSTKIQIRKTIKRALRKKVISSLHGIQTATMGLTAGAVTEAALRGKKKVTISDLENGWEKHISTIGNCPPYRCLMRSVISRKEELMEENKIFKLLVSQINEEEF